MSCTGVIDLWGPFYNHPKGSNIFIRIMKKFVRLHALVLLFSFLAASAFAQNKDWLLKMQDPDVNFWELQKEFNDYWKDRTDYKGNGYKVFKRWEYINEMRVGPDGKLPTLAHVIKEYNRYMADAPESASGAWTITGPTTYPSNNTGQPTGKGRVNAIAFHPTDVNTLFIGSPSGGIWKSSNGGANWTNLSSNLPFLGVSSILIHPSNPNIMYIGTGDRDGSDSQGFGVYKSTDGGSTWTQMSTGMGNATVGILLMHPSDPNTLIAATKSGIYKTTNAGASWSLKQAGDFRDIKFKPGDPTVMYATRMITPSEFYRSTNTGDNWTLTTTPTSGVGSRMVIGVSPANAAYVYLVQIKDTDRTFKAFLKSTDSGVTFTEQSNSPNIFDYKCNGSGTASQATYDLIIDVDQTNAEIVYVGSINSWKSTNGGVNWSPVTHWVGSTYAPGDPTANCAASVHADHHWYQWSPLHSPARLYLGHDGGISYTADGGTTWTEISNDLPTGQIYKIGQSAQAANTVTAGFQDNGVSATNNGTSFTTIGGGDGFDGIIDYNNANYCYFTVNGSLNRSTTGLFGTYFGISSSIGGTPSFFADYKLHHTDPNTMFFGRYDVWRSNNIRSIPSTSVNWMATSSFSGTDLIRVMEQSTANPDMMYISRGSGSGSVLYRSDNVNASAGSVVWNTITKPNNSLSVSDIAAYPTNENIVFATAGTKVYRSADKGVSWTDITGNLPSLFINCIVIDKNANEGIYIGNQAGVWYKNATLTNWVLFSSGLPPVDVRELEIYYDVNPNNNRITAATYGRGVWQSDLIQVNTIDPSNLAASPVSTNQIDLSWTLNASNDNVLIATSPTTIFGVPAEGTAYTAGNSLPGGGTVVYVGNLTNFSHTGLTTGTPYCYKIWSVNGSNQYSAGLTPVCANTFSHYWTGNVSTDWFNTGNWGAGTVPTAADGAYIPAGRTNYPLINAAGATCYHLTIESGASVAMDAVTPYTLQVTGDWTNDGTFTPGLGTVEFNGTNALQTIKGTSTTDFNILQVNKGALGNILEATSLITLNGSVNPLTITSGTFKLSSASTITPFTDGAGADLTTGKGLWNNGGVINSGAFGWFLNAGLLRVSAGTVNVGTNPGNSIDYLNNGTLIMEGGALNIAARFTANVPASSIGQYIQTGGTLTVFTVGSSSTTQAPFNLSPNTSFTMSGGTIVVQRQSSNTNGEVVINTSNHNVTGGTLQIGNASTPAAQTIRINSTAPIYNLTVNATNAPTAQLFTNGLTVKNDVTISGGALNANSLNMNVGGHWTNNGAFTPGSGTVTFNGTANQNLAGSNAATFNNLTMNNAAGLTLSGSVNTTVNGTLNLTSGVISTGSNQVIIGSVGSVSRTSGHIFGQLQKNAAAGAGISRTFEIGDASAANYTPATITFANVSAAGNLTASAVSGDHPQIAGSTLNATKSANRYWSFTNSGIAFDTYDAIFNFLNSDLDPSANTSNLICGKYNAPNWTYPSVGTRTASSTEITGVASFSDFQLAELDCADPDVPTLSATATTICSGQSTDLNIASGSLNDAADWQWYTVSCGGTAAGTGASLTVSPTTTTTYYARGEGGCVTPGTCGSITIIVDQPPSATAGGNAAICSSSAYTLTGAEATASNGTVQWTHNGAGTLSDANTLTPTYQAAAGDAGNTVTLTLTVTSDNSCAPQTAQATYSIAVAPACILNLNTNTYYPTIQDAIDNATAGDELEIGAGTYPGCVTVDRSIKITPSGGAVIIACLTMNAPSGNLVMGGDLAINNLTLTNGRIRTNGFKLTVGTVSGGSAGSYIVTD